MFLIRKPIDFKSIKELVRIYSIARKSHYEVLKLRRNCTDKEIKDAFIQMSKEYHPDKNKDARAQEMFVRIVEAYNVLGKPSSRAHYDNRTEISAHASYNAYRNAYNVHHNTTNTSNNYNYYQQSYGQTNSSYSSQEHTTRHDDQWYYGLKGIKKLPNMYIIGLCCAIACVGVIFQVYVIRNMYVIQRRKAQERSQFLAEELNRVRTAARDNGNELQTRLLLDKIVMASNPTVTTASLGQALASEKKDSTELLTEFGVAEPPDKWCNDSINQNIMKTSNMNQSYLTW